MNKKVPYSYIVFLFLVLPALLFSSQRGKAVTSLIEGGTYVESDIITAEKLKWMPIPKGTGNYVLYQSIQMISSVVIGNFTMGESAIILIQDINADEKVDVVVFWFKDSDKLKLDDKPDQFCPQDKFRKLKEIIINGQSEAITLGGKEYYLSPNREGISEFEKLVKIPSNVQKYKQGLRIRYVDPDETTNEMSVYSYSYNSADDTVDIAFNVRYFYRGDSRVSPIINYGVYCQKSIDPFAKEKVKQLREISTKYFK